MGDDSLQLERRAKGSTMSARSVGSVGRVVTVQVCLYAVMILGTCTFALFSSGVPTLVWSTVIGLVLLGAFVVFWPFKTSDAQGTNLVIEWFGRIVAAIAGLFSLAFSIMELKALLEPAVIGGRAKNLLPWAAVFVILAALLIVIDFALQMARKERSHLIRSLSESIFGAIACVSAGAWPFLAFMVVTLADSYQQRLAMALVIVGLVAMLALLSVGVASTLWWRDIKDGDQHTWIGIAILPVMFAGVVAYLVAISVFFVLI
ncbi:MAG: hypothetical protein ABF747_03280 [Bifidobacterium sp.]|uniref:Uncharacterized protein n=2 Tax=Bifidobacterium TaxID=1678 RepID=A0AB39UDY0_9BIFI